jgi:hypothetical protein
MMTEEKCEPSGEIAFRGTCQVGISLKRTTHLLTGLTIKPWIPTVHRNPLVPGTVTSQTIGGQRLSGLTSV